MRAPQMVNDFFEWRWAPCVGLTAGSLAFVAFALLLIPTRFDGEPRTARTLSAFDSPRTQRALYASSWRGPCPKQTKACRRARAPSALCPSPAHKPMRPAPYCGADFHR